MTEIDMNLTHFDSLIKRDGIAPSYFMKRHEMTAPASFVSLVLDFKKISESPLLPILVKVINPYIMYQSLRFHNLEESVEILEHLKGTALIHVLDFDLWKEQEGRLDLEPRRLIDWLSIWSEFGTDFIVERLFEFEEDMIVSILSALFYITPHDLLTKDQKRAIEIHADDIRIETPDKHFYFYIQEQYKCIEDILLPLVREMYGMDFQYARMLFSYSSMLIREESLDNFSRWRTARLEGLGFSLEDSRSILFPKENKIQKSLTTTKNNSENIRLFSDDLNVANEITVQEKQESAVVLSSVQTLSSQNQESHSLIASGHSVSEDNLLPETVLEIKKFLSAEENKQAVFLAMTQSMPEQLPWEEIAHISNPEELIDDTFIEEKFSSILEIALTTIQGSLKSLIDENHYNPSLILNKVIKKLQQDGEIDLLTQIQDTIVCLTNKLLGATLRNQAFELSAEDQATFADVVFNAMNLALEKEIFEARQSELSLSEIDKNEVISYAVSTLKVLGANELFHRGFFLICQVREQGAKTLDTVFNKKESLFKMLRQHNQRGIRIFTRSLEHKVSNEVFLVLAALFNSPPLFSKVLEAERPEMFVTQATRSFATLRDLKRISLFFENLSRNLEESISSEEKLFIQATQETMEGTV